MSDKATRRGHALRTAAAADQAFAELWDTVEATRDACNRMLAYRHVQWSSKDVKTGLVELGVLGDHVATCSDVILYLETMSRGSK